MLTEQQLQALPKRLYDRFRNLNTALITMIAARVKAFSETKRDDPLRLMQLSDIHADMRRYEDDLQDALRFADAEIERTMTAASEQEYDFIRTALSAVGVSMISHQDNLPAQQALRLAITSTQSRIHSNAQNLGLFTLPNVGSNISGTNAFNLPQWRHVQQVYRDVIDRAALAVRTGETDFHSAMRSAIRTMADHGHTFVQYDSGNPLRPRHFRMDSTVRRDLMDAQARLSMEYSDLIADQIGADGFEISLTSAPRPSHVWIGGQQFDMETFYRDVEPLMEEYNCYHRKHAIILGVSPPAHTDAEIAAHNARDAELHEFGGKQYNAYEAQQRQRQYELQIRKHKDRAVALKTSGDLEHAHISSARARAVQAEYARFSSAMGIRTKQTRTGVEGYRYVGNPASITRLPNATRAIIPESKIVDYLLSPTHPVGKHKARVIESALGYNQSSWKQFEAELRSKVETAPLTSSKSFTYEGENGIINAMKHNVVIEMQGIIDRSLRMTTAWQIDEGTETPRFITLTFLKRK